MKDNNIKRYKIENYEGKQLIKQLNLENEIIKKGERKNDREFKKIKFSNLELKNLKPNKLSIYDKKIIYNSKVEDNVYNKLDKLQQEYNNKMELHKQDDEKKDNNILIDKIDELFNKKYIKKDVINKINLINEENLQNKKDINDNYILNKIYKDEEQEKINIKNKEIEENKKIEKNKKIEENINLKKMNYIDNIKKYIEENIINDIDIIELAKNYFSDFINQKINKIEKLVTENKFEDDLVDLNSKVESILVQINKKKIQLENDKKNSDKRELKKIKKEQNNKDKIDKKKKYMEEETEKLNEVLKQQKEKLDKVEEEQKEQEKKEKDEKINEVLKKSKEEGIKKKSFIINLKEKFNNEIKLIINNIDLIDSELIELKNEFSIIFKNFNEKLNDLLTSMDNYEFFEKYCIDLYNSSIKSINEITKYYIKNKSKMKKNLDKQKKKEKFLEDRPIRLNEKKKDYLIKNITENYKKNINNLNDSYEKEHYEKTVNYLIENINKDTNINDDKIKEYIITFNNILDKYRKSKVGINLDNKKSILEHNDLLINSNLLINKLKNIIPNIDFNNISFIFNKFGKMNESDISDKTNKNFKNFNDNLIKILEKTNIEKNYKLLNSSEKDNKKTIFNNLKSLVSLNNPNKAKNEKDKKEKFIKLNEINNAWDEIKKLRNWK